MSRLRISRHRDRWGECCLVAHGDDPRESAILVHFQWKSRLLDVRDAFSQPGKVSGQRPFALGKPILRAPVRLAGQ